MNMSEIAEKTKAYDVTGKIKDANRWYDGLSRTKRIALTLALGAPILVMKWFGVAYFMGIILIAMVGSSKEE
jgi:hypothetical protein